MDTFSLNPKIHEKSDDLYKVISQKLNQYGREYLTDVTLRIAGDEVMASGKDKSKQYKNTNVNKYGWSMSGFDLVDKTRKESNIISTQEVNSGFRQGVHDRTMPDLANSRILGYLGVDDMVTRPDVAKEWWSLYDEAIIEFGINIVKCLDLAERGILRDEVKVRFVEVIKYYKAETLLLEIARDEVLKEACMDELAFTTLLRGGDSAFVTAV